MIVLLLLNVSIYWLVFSLVLLVMEINTCVMISQMDSCRCVHGMMKLMSVIKFGSVKT